MNAQPTEITRYPNRRLYDRSRGQYVTLPEIADRIRDGEMFVVRDRKSGEDVTRSILAQIILERFPERMDMFPAPLLHLMLRANDLAFDWMRAYLRETLSFLGNLPAAPTALTPPFVLAPPGQPKPGAGPASAPSPVDWMKTFWSPWMPTAAPAGNPPGSTAGSPETAHPTVSDAPASVPPTPPQPSAEELASRLAELERRLRDLEGPKRSLQ